MNVTVWNENFDEMNQEPDVLAVHPNGIHETVADILRGMNDPGIQVTTATLDQPECGLPDSVLEQTDVLVWWSHKRHEQVPDALAEKIHHRILKGMGFIALHSSHYCKVLKRLLGTTCDLSWRDNSYERMFCVAPAHPIAEGVPPEFEVGIDEMYSEPFDIAPPDELVFLAWFDTGNLFRAGCTWKRGYGKVFYFQPGHETNRSYENPHIRRILQNAVRWAYSPARRGQFGSPHVDEAPEQRWQDKG